MEMEPMEDRLVGRRVVCLEETGSTNDVCKQLAREGAQEGLCVLAQRQTAGRGRRGRSFASPSGGLYLSVLLRPKAPPEALSRLTAWVGVAVCRGVEKAAGARPQIKWPNDLLLGGKKLCGILVERTGETVVVGVGVNVDTTADQFGPELAQIATSLALQGVPTSRETLARALLDELDRMARAFPGAWEEYLAEYRRRCVTAGRAVSLVRDGAAVPARALGVNDDFSLRVRFPDGREEDVSSGEVSVRGPEGS